MLECSLLKDEKGHPLSAPVPRGSVGFKFHAEITSTGSDLKFTNHLQEQLILTGLERVCVKFLPPHWWVLSVNDEKEVLLPFSRGTKSVVRLGLWGKGILLPPGGSLSKRARSRLLW